MTGWLFDGPARARATVILAHGAGAPMDSPFMVAIAGGLARHGLRVARFEFPYMAASRVDGRRRPPDRQPALLDAWRAALADHDPRRLVIGGKSMGGRMASLIADEAGVAGLVCFGFPFHAPGKPAAERIGHLARLATPTLIVQGRRDTMGNATEVPRYDLSAAITIHWIDDADHSLVPSKASGVSEHAAWAGAADRAAQFVRAVTER
jgi:predicted alpha/beta-hydrolase family hydrolase